MKRLIILYGIIFFSFPLIGNAQQSSADTVTFISEEGDTMQVTPAMRDSLLQSQEAADTSETAVETSKEAPDVKPSRGFRYQDDFRGVPWGADLATAKERLNRSDYSREDAEALAWYDTIAEDSVYVRLYFYEDQFWQASFTYLLRDEASIQDYSKKFQGIEEVLVEKYGNPDKMRRITWDDSQYIGDVDAIAMGQGLYQSRWFFGDANSSKKAVTMDLLLQGMNFRPNLVLQYSKPAVIKKVEKAKEDTLIQYY